MPTDLDLGEGVRGLHHIPSDAKVFLPASIERKRWPLPLHGTRKNETIQRADAIQRQLFRGSVKEDIMTTRKATSRSWSAFLALAASTFVAMVGLHAQSNPSEPHSPVAAKETVL